MNKRIRVRGIPRSEPDVRLYVLALIELARKLQEEETAAKHAQRPGGEAAEGGTHG